MNNAQRQQLQQQQQQQQQQLKLRNPTQYHLQMQQARTSQQPGKSASGEYYNVDPQLWQSDFFNSLQQHQTNESPKLEDMDFADTVNPSMVSPHSTTSPLHEFDDFNDYNVTGSSTNPSSFSTHGMKSPLRQAHLSGAELFGESPANSVNSYGVGDGQDMHYQEPTMSGSPQVSVPIDMRKASGNFGHPLATNGQYPMYIPGSSFEKQPHLAMSAPANIGYGGRPFGSYSNGSAFGSQLPGSSLRMHAEDASDMAGSFEDDYATQLNLQGVMEKRRRRRESHNAVERRRRDNINDRIHELGTLLPDMENDNINKPNKGYILRKSVEQIKALQTEVTEYSQRVKDLESMLEQYRSGQANGNQQS
ncbi:hypothetical protein INT43_006490 [Umbelopsis isabellina]|uniref:BHLH domain-containing protein n=1 Tax=Mortierella isabellina TaxID=91625 RepID=A0A8H7Q1S5_MORIS|nr:hypothetical protein INT43_006490 [Umbelopsis isabellina]